MMTTTREQEPTSLKDVAVVLIGHGVPALDCPPQLVGEMMGLEFSGGGDHRARIAELDAQIRNWPRPAGNDPYKEGLDRLAGQLRELLPSAYFAVGYNEFCAPSVQEAVEQVIGQGAKRVLVIPSMLTPGGLHSEKDIPRALDQVRKKQPQVSIEYVWPFDLKAVGKLLAEHLQAKLEGQAV